MDTQRTATLGDVRLAIFRQHTQLEQLSDELEAHAMAVVSGGERSLAGKALNQALELLNTHFVRHFDYEEAHLARWLAWIDDDPDHSLLGDHGDQRSRMQGLLHDRDVFGDPCTLAHEALAFVHHLRKDLADEDAKIRALGRGPSRLRRGTDCASSQHMRRSGWRIRRR